LNFLDRLDTESRQRLLDVGQVQHLEPGDYMIRRGEQGGDLYLVETGTFDVVDTRSVPEVILQVVGAGAVQGEMAFLDGAVRTADLRCTSRAKIRTWKKARLDEALSSDVELARSFYRALAEVTTKRLRSMVNLGSSENRTRLGEGVEVEREAQLVASEVLSVWAELDMRIRRDPKDPESRATIGRAFEKLQERARHWLGGIQDSEERQQAGEALCRTVQPFLQQAHLCEYALRSNLSDLGRQIPSAHIIRDHASGYGLLGSLLDAVLLRLPTSQAIRSTFRTLTQIIEGAVPSDRPARVALIGVGSGALISDLSIRLARRGASFQLVDGDPQVLDSLDMGMSVRPKSVDLNLVRMDLGLLAMGRGRLSFGPQDLVVVESLANHLPDRLLASLVGQLREQVGEEGRLLICGLAPSRDSVIFDHLLRWPMIRRSRRQFIGLIEAAGYGVRGSEDGNSGADCSLVLSARRD
jgi:CRP-like cAMP-binding protein